jgi:hypothetical protein
MSTVSAPTTGSPTTTSADRNASSARGEPSATASTAAREGSREGGGGDNRAHGLDGGEMTAGLRPGSDDDHSQRAVGQPLEDRGDRDRGGAQCRQRGAVERRPQ